MNNRNTNLYDWLSPRQLMWIKFKKHRVARICLVLLLMLYVSAFTYKFWIPYDPGEQNISHIDAPPTKIHLFDHNGHFKGPFVYKQTGLIDQTTYKRVFKDDTTILYKLDFFTKGFTYKIFGLECNRHFFGAGEGKLFLFGSDRLGRDLFSRILSGSLVSLTIGFGGVIISMILGIILGGISGYIGGKIDALFQRLIEIFLSIPTIPLWMGLSAAVPRDWSPIKVYLAITLILSFMSWPSLARVVRGKFLELKEHDFVTASRLSGAGNTHIILKHLLPGVSSYLIVHLTLAVPNMILAETALSFLGLGIRSPAVSWGSLMQDSQNIVSIAMYPWRLIPGVFVIFTVLLFNFIGDGLRDAVDPYKV